MVLGAKPGRAVVVPARRDGRLVEGLYGRAVVGGEGLAADPEKGMSRWLLVGRSTDDPEDHGFYQAYGPEETPIEELVRVCQDRWAIEQCFAEAKGEVGMDHYEVRRWDAWHRHVTLCLLAHAFLVVVRIAARDEEEAGRGGKRGISIRA